MNIVCGYSVLKYCRKIVLVSSFTLSFFDFKLKTASVVLISPELYHFMAQKLIL